MNAGTKGQQIIDTVMRAHHFMHEGFGDYYIVALCLGAFWCLLWFAKQSRDVKRKRAAKRRSSSTPARKRSSTRDAADAA